MRAVALLDYRNRGSTQTSGNLGDMMQTVAMGRLVAKWLRLWARVHGRRGPDGLLDVVSCPRDEQKRLTPATLLLLYGWHMHRCATNAFAFPPEAANALATSLHVSSDQVLTEAAVRFLSEHGPVGCRDFSTLRKLRARGVPSFYSGCVTLSLPPSKLRRTGAVTVDTVTPDPAAQRLEVWSVLNRALSPRQMWLRALCVLRLLRRTAKVYSSRLHILYPCLASGTPALLQSPTGDQRTDWGAPGRWETARLYASGERDHRADARLLERQLAATLGRVMAGEAVGAAWRRAVLIHVAFCFDAAFVTPTLACANSLLAHNGEKPLFLHLFHRGVKGDDLAEMRRRLLKAHPGTMLEFHACESEITGYGTHLKHVSAQTMERLWLHERLPTVSRLLYVDGDMIVRGSVQPLLDLRVPVLAARNSVENIMKTESWNRGLGYTGETCFNAGLLVLNLAALRRMRFSDFVRRVLEVQTCNDQTILNLFCQGRHTALPRKWNYFAREPSDIGSGEDPTIIHFCGSKKPWNSDSVHMGAEWHRYRL